MINTRDEIMIKFATDGEKPEVDPIRFPITTRVLEEEDIEPGKPKVDPTRFPITTQVLREEGIDEAPALPATEVAKPPLSQRDFIDPFTERGLTPSKYIGTDWPWEDPRPDSVEWAAQHYTQEYLRGVDKPFRGYARDPENDHITKVTMDRLIAVEPENYFAWGLRRRQELKPWLVPAAEALIDRDPYTALMKGIYEQGEEVKHLLPKLWKDVVEAELTRSSETESGQVFPGILFNRMRSLAGEIARVYPEFYIDEIAGSGIGRKFRTTQFDNWAHTALKDKQRR